MFIIDTKAARTAWTYAAVGLTLWGLLIVRKTILLFILSLMFAYLFYPLLETFQQRLQIKTRMTALGLLCATVALAIAGSVCLLRGPLREEGRNLRQQIGGTEFRRNLANWHILGIPVGEQIVEVHGLASVQNRLESETMEVMPMVGRGIGRVVRDIGNIFIIPILGFFMLLDGRNICDRLVGLYFFPAGTRSKEQQIVEGILDDAHALILQYMRALLFLCFAVLFFFSITLKLMGVKYALLLALVAFPLEFIPLVGPLVAALVIIAVCEFNQYPHLPWVIGFLIVYRLFQDYVLSPHLMKKSVKLHPLLVIFGILAGGEIGGVGGIFLSVPLLALTRLVFYECRKYAAAMRDAAATSRTELSVAELAEQGQKKMLSAKPHQSGRRTRSLLSAR
jgi:predicted PurR-regulated permease PerM